MNLRGRAERREQEQETEDMCEARVRHEVTSNFTDSLIDALLVHTTCWR